MVNLIFPEGQRTSPAHFSREEKPDPVSASSKGKVAALQVKTSKSYLTGEGEEVGFSVQHEEDAPLLLDDDKDVESAN